MTEKFSVTEGMSLLPHGFTLQSEINRVFIAQLWNTRSNKNTFMICRPTFANIIVVRGAVKKF